MKGSGSFAKRLRADCTIVGRGAYASGTNYRLAKEIGVPPQRIGEIIAGRRAITADTDLRLCRFFGLSEGWWLRLQADHDTRKARVALAKELAKIKPLKERA